jgi:hypothetical protein
VFEPDPGRKGLYDELFGLYRDCYTGLKAVFHTLSTPRSQS